LLGPTSRICGRHLSEKFINLFSRLSETTHGMRQAPRFVVACTLFFIFPVGCTYGAEGFFADKLPPAVRAAWPSVYAFVCEGRGGRYVASAFLVKKTVHGAQADYSFITAGHAVDDCRQAKRYLVEDINQPRFERDGITIAAAPQRFTDVRTIYVDDAYDVAVVRVSAAASARFGTPIKVGDGCDRALHRQVYAVGFPGVGQRRSLRQARETKRWSRGEYVGLGRAEFRGTNSIYIAATVDSLPGSSGGPVVDESGQLIGVMAKGAAAPENGFRYDVDPHKADDWQSFLVPCQAVVRIMQRSDSN
jgi:S1-C subfamily serine protease